MTIGSIGSFGGMLLRIAGILFLVYVLLVGLIFLFQRSLLYFPTHFDSRSVLEPWLDGEERFGFCREVSKPDMIWLMMHGNAGQASDRDYVLPRISERDSLYVLEYPGYGKRAGNPTMSAINQAAIRAYRKLREENPNIPIGVIGESIGSGPACVLASESVPPDKIELVVPFDTLANVASDVFPFLPVRLLLLDRWNNVEALRDYSGLVRVYAAEDDRIIPPTHARALAEEAPNAVLIEIPGGHNEWAFQDSVVFEH